MDGAIAMEPEGALALATILFSFYCSISYSEFLVGALKNKISHQSYSRKQIIIILKIMEIGLIVILLFLCLLNEIKQIELPVF